MPIHFNENLIRRGTNSIKWDKVESNVIPMFIADMDFTVASEITERIIKRALHRVYGYTFPDSELYSAVQQWVKEMYAYELKEEWIEFIGGIVPALSVVSNLVEGKSITNIPNYKLLLDAPAKAGNELIKVPLKNKNENYTFDFEALEAAITTDVKLFYLCNPHNPIGKAYTKAELKQLSEFAQKHNLLVVSDEIHCELVYDKKHIPFYTVDNYAREHSITLHSPGKICNVAGVNLAIAIIPNKKIRENFLKAGYAMSHPGIFEFETALAAYAESQSWKKEVVAYLKENRDYLEQQLKFRFPKAKFPHAEATYLQWIDFRPYGEQYTSEYFLKEAKIAFSDGKDFGGPGYVRLNFGCSREVLDDALDRLEVVINKRNNGY